MAKKPKRMDNIICDVCGYQNHKYFVKQSGVCHLCGKILDEKAYFKCEMNKRLRLWRGKRKDGTTWWNTQ